MWSSSAEISAKRYRYTGKEKDEESGLYYHGARYYAPWLGRWTAADPLGVRGGLNFYAYASANPVSFSDPSGLAPLNADGSINSSDRNVQRLRAHGWTDGMIRGEINKSQLKTTKRQEANSAGGAAGNRSSGGANKGARAPNAGGGDSSSGGGEGPDGGDILTGPGLDPNDPLNGNLDAHAGGGDSTGNGAGGDSKKEKTFGQKLAEVAGKASLEEAKEKSSETSETGVPGGGAKPGALLDSAAGQVIAAAIVIADAIATVVSLAKAAFAIAKKLGGKLIEKIGEKLFKGVAEAAEEGITKGAKEGIEELTPKFDSTALKATKSAGDAFEDSVKETFRKKIIRENEEFFDSAGRKLGEIDFETGEAIYEVGLSLGGKTPQLHKLAAIAKERGKRLDVVYGPNTSPGTLRALQESLQKKWGNRVRFIPHG